MPPPHPPLSRADLDPDPVRQFGLWYAGATEAGEPRPEVMVCATATRDGAPSARYVLLRAWDARGFVFFTSYAGRKAQEIAGNPRGALAFYWDEVGRQVRVEGVVEAAAPEESDAYWGTRSRDSQLSAAAARQSAPLADRATMEARMRAIDAEHAGRPIPRPPEWGGYRVVPDYFEFWQRGEHRAHDRFAYERAGDAWRLQRLWP